jgi:hypothetical protein
VKAVSELIVRVTDLVEAEGRSIRQVIRSEGHELRERVSRFSLGLVFLVGAAVLVLMGTALCVATVYAALEPSVGVAGALLSAGVFALACGGVLIWVFKKVQAS